MRIEQLHYLLELYRTRSFSKAAENVFITQPSLSTAISGLEDELGVKLFERLRSGVYPTPMGEAVVKIASELVNCEARIYEAVRAAQPPDKIRLMTIPAISFGVLLELMTSFQKDYPEVNLELKEFPPQIITDAVVDELTNVPGTFALVPIQPKTREEVLAQLARDNITSTHIFSDNFVAHMSGKHPLASKEVISIDDFLAYPSIELNLLTKTPDNTAYNRLYMMGNTVGRRRLKERTHIEVDSLAHVKHLMLSTGTHVVALPRLIASGDRDYESGDIIWRPFVNGDDLSVDYYLIYSSLYPLKPIEEGFLNAIVAYFDHLSTGIEKGDL